MPKTTYLIVAGFLSADRIQAHSITANHLASDVGQSLDLSSNKTIILTVESVVEKAVGYQVEVVSERGVVLSEHVPATTLRVRVWKGSAEVTESIDVGRLIWTRQSSDETADRVWNAAHVGIKSISLTTADVLYSANYSRDLDA